MSVRFCALSHTILIAHAQLPGALIPVSMDTVPSISFYQEKSWPQGEVSYPALHMSACPLSPSQKSLHLASPESKVTPAKLWVMTMASFTREFVLG